MIQIDVMEDGSFLLPVRVIPRGGKNGIMPYRQTDTCVMIKVTTPPEDGKANQAVIRILSDTFRYPKRDIMIVRGETSRQKMIRIHYMDNPQELFPYPLKLLADAMHCSLETVFDVRRGHRFS